LAVFGANSETGSYNACRTRPKAWFGVGAEPAGHGTDQAVGGRARDAVVRVGEVDCFSVVDVTRSCINYTIASMHQIVVVAV
jgi:hypothetical protein